MPPLHSCWRGQHHGLAPCVLSARPVRTSLALHPLAPHLAQAPGGGSSHANGGARAPHPSAPPRQRAQPLRGPHAHAALRLVCARDHASPSAASGAPCPPAPNEPPP